MRPLRLDVKGFTAFRDPVEVDFTELDVFAISGPTGSGKSSLLDAMTYALYGRVERVGDRVSQLISQGQPRMAVTLEFEVGRDRYRVTRSTPAKGATKILLERLIDGVWLQAGEGSDRVREADSILARAIGLTYDGFTRSVLLPQGRFAEFLVGDAKKRRDILTELLGLSLFRRMAERAGSIAKESSVRAQTTTDVLEREYSDATTDALKEARRATRKAQEREKVLGEAGERVLEVLGRSEESKRSMDELRALADEAAGVAERAGAAAEELATLAGRLAEAAEVVQARAAASETARKALGQARKDVQVAEALAGPAGELARAQVRAHSLMEAVQARELKADQRSRAADAAARLRKELETAGRALAGQQQLLAAHGAEVLRAEAALEEARHADLVAAVSSGLKIGDPCPVCGLRLERPPKKRAAGALRQATGALTDDRKALESAREAEREAERAADGAGRELLANAAELARLASELEELDLRIAEERVAIEAVLREPLPEDPAAAIDELLEELQRLDHAEREATRLVAEGEQALLRAEQERDRVAALIDRQRDRLAVDRQPLFDRAARVIGGKVAPIGPAAPPDADDPDALWRHAESLAAALGAFTERLRNEVGQRSSVEQALLEEASATVGDLVEPAPTLEALAGAVDAACRSATAEVATMTQHAEALASRVERRKEFAAEADRLDGRGRLFKALALELRADRLIAFLQVEALQVLAAAGSQRLASLSDGRYRLVCRDDEFMVVDTWNGDEERSVRTLSGGETFLASLALALAVADQVRSLSTTDRARLDSLFLDEGFGTLDAESLGIVVDAIEQLADDGRLIGVITHVRELAEQFPRVEVEKSPRGSRLKLLVSDG